ncbi:MAG: site-specific integrase [Actinomycetota bacterium]
MQQDPRIADFLEALQLERDASPHTVTAYRTDLAELQGYLEARGLDLDRVDGRDLEPYALGLRERAGAARRARRTRGRPRACGGAGASGPPPAGGARWRG